VSIATTDHSSDECLLPIATVIHCSDVVIGIGQLPMAKLAYNQLLQCMFVVVDEGLLLACHHYSCQLQSLYDPTPPLAPHQRDHLPNHLEG
jgi:hypothetical protein